MRILIVKMSSLGDVVHMLPALTEAARHVPGLRADWLVEEAFAAIPAWHPAVARSIPVALRRWRRAPFAATTRAEFRHFRTVLNTQHYDLVLDSQGLIKSAAVSLLASGPRAGQDFASARESLACLAYGRRFAAPRNLHAIARNRLLTAQALGYRMGDEADLHYGMSLPLSHVPVRTGMTGVTSYAQPACVVLHGTARAEKEYPEADWIALLRHIHAQSGITCLLPWGNPREQARAQRLAAAVPGAQVLPKLGLSELSGVIASAVGVIGVDTGLMHLAAALGRPGVALYPATPPGLYGVRCEPGAPPIVNLAVASELAPAFAADRFMKTLQPSGLA